LEKCGAELRGGRKAEDVGSCLRAFEACLTRRERIRTGEVRREFAVVSEEVSGLQVELKRKAIRAMLDQKEAEKQQAANRELQAQVEELRRKASKETKEASSSTDECGWQLKSTN
jgi:ABC-type phosphate transport system auxiliary subunit